MNYATICSGIGAPEVAWKDLWGRPEFVSEIEPFPSAALKHHYPDVPNYGDMTKYKEWPDHELELICGGTPCQSFSVAGFRKGMDDPRGNLTLVYLGILARYNPRWFIWENVPGVFSSRSNGGSDFGRFLSALAELGYSCAYRVLDAQYFGVPQRRRRVFVVGHLGADWRPPYAVLFEPESMRRNTPKGGKAGEGTARAFEIGPGGSGECEVIPTLDSRCCVAIQPRHTKANWLNVSEGGPAYTLDETGGQAVAFQPKASVTQSMNPSEICPTIGTTKEPAVLTLAIRGRQDGSTLECRDDGKANAILTPNSGRGGIGVGAIASDTIVRRLTPMECERLQGFPDNYTAIPDYVGRGKKDEWYEEMRMFHARQDNAIRTTHDGFMYTDLTILDNLARHPDGPRYKALGNSMAVPVLRWIGQRIQLWESLVKSGKIKA